MATYLPLPPAGLPSHDRTFNVEYKSREVGGTSAWNALGHRRPVCMRHGLVLICRLSLLVYADRDQLPAWVLSAGCPLPLWSLGMTKENTVPLGLAFSAQRCRPPCALMM